LWTLLFAVAKIVSHIEKYGLGSTQNSAPLGALGKRGDEPSGPFFTTRTSAEFIRYNEKEIGFLEHVTSALVLCSAKNKPP
jgi:hypothetical protein